MKLQINRIWLAVALSLPVIAYADVSSTIITATGSPTPETGLVAVGQTAGFGSFIAGNAGNTCLGGATCLFSVGSYNTVTGNNNGFFFNGDHNIFTGFQSGTGLIGSDNQLSGEYVGTNLIGNGNIGQGLNALDNYWVGSQSYGLNGNNNIAFGKNAGPDSEAQWTSAFVSDSNSFGTGAHANTDRGGAYGAFSVVHKGATDSVALGSFSDASQANVVSIGTEGLLRRIVHMQDGIDPTDGATVGQASVLAQVAADAAVTAATPGILSAAAVYADTVGNNTLNSAYAYADNNLTIAKNYADSVEINANNFTRAAIAAIPLVDTSGLLKTDGSRAMSGNLDMGGNRLTNVGTAIENTDGVNFLQMKNADQVVYNDAVDHADGLVYQTNGVETAQMTLTPTTAALTVTNSLGNTHGITVDTTHTVISGGTTSTSLTLDNSGATLATVATGAPAQLHGLAAGTAGTDAVNVDQLNTAIAGFNGGADTKRLDGRIDGLSNDIKQVAKRAYGGAALAMAMSGPQPVTPGQIQTSMGIANFNGESAIAGSISRAVENGAVVSFGGGVTSAGDVGFRGTISWAWNPTSNTLTTKKAKVAAK